MMIIPGIASVTFRDLTPSEVVDAAKAAGLRAIEWGGDCHVPPGEVALAREVQAMTEEAGLDVASYGSYYRVGCGGDFEPVAQTAHDLGAPLIRIWAGNWGSDVSSKNWWDTVVADAQHVADVARDRNVLLAFEYHANTLADTAESAERLIRDIGWPNVTCYWQPTLGAGRETCHAGLRQLMPWVSNVHVFHYDEGRRVALDRGRDDWREYLALLATLRDDHYALIEFVEEGMPENLMRDAETLLGLIDALPENRGESE